MFRRHPILILITHGVICFASPIVLALTVGGDSDLWFLAFVGVFLLGVFPLIRVMSRFESDLEEADYDRRLEPVKQSVETCWLMTEKKELDHRHRLVRQILLSLNVSAKPESPLPTGTRVDAYMEFGDEDWYITIKRGLKKNQQRLILQGEIEDIILHAPRKDRDLWICVVVGVSDELDPNEMAHFRQLCEYAAQRSIIDTRARRDRNGKMDRPRVNIEVMPAIIPSSPLTSEELQELELERASA